MKTYKFHGYSDDTFGEYGVTNFDYDNCASLEPISLLFKIKNECLVVTGQYGKRHAGETWSIQVSSFDDNPFPNWPIRIKAGINPDYSPVLEIDAPAGAEITVI